MSNPKITVIVPTRTRPDVLKGTLENILRQDYARMEVLISDNFSCDDTELVTKSFNDPRIRYINTGKRISMTENWEFALSHVKEGWVTILGDDDGLAPNALNRVASLIAEYDVLAIRSSSCFFAWPCLRKSSFGALSVPIQSGVELRNSAEWLGRVIAGETGYPALPMLYYGGFVSTEVVDQIKQVTGQFFKSSIPDVYSAVALASVLSNYLFVRQPLALNGASAHSTGTSAMTGGSLKRGSPAEKYISEKGLPFHEKFLVPEGYPFPPSLHLATLECVAQSEPLRKTKISLDWEDQLRIILSKAEKNKYAIYSWAKRFAAENGINFEQVVWNSKNKSTRKAISDVWKWRILPQSVELIGSESSPLASITEAAQLIPGVLAESSTSFRAKTQYLLAEYARNSIASLSNIKLVLCRSVRKAKELATKACQSLLPVRQQAATHHDKRLADLFELFEIDLVFDVGANVGQFTQGIRKGGYSGSIVSFEPLSKAHSALSQNAALDIKWSIHPRCALGDSTGQITINISGNSQSSSILPILSAHSAVDPESAYVSSESTPVFRADDVWQPYLEKASRPFVKLDVQGYEWQVLDGASESLEKISGIAVELSLVPLYEGQRLWKEIIERLETEGFTLWSIDRVFADPIDRRLLQIDALFFRV